MAPRTTTGSFGDIDQDVLFDRYGAAARGGGIFGLSFTREESGIVLLPVPWEATVSYGGGTAEGPAAILRASPQVDFFDRDLGLFYKAGIVMLPESGDVRKWNREARRSAQTVMERGGVVDANRKDAEVVRVLGERLNASVYDETKKVLEEGKIPGLVGGDHSTPLGAIRACAEAKGPLGVFHIDAHFDTRKSFEGFPYSHGSIMRNVADTVSGVTKLVQVGIRDFCREEMEFARSNERKIAVFFDEDMAGRQLSGESWRAICEEIVSALPQKVYISFDIDGLDPSLCPHTGTPVPGGLSFNQMLLLLKTVVKSGRQIVGFDLVEVAPGREGEWDANVGARVLFKLCGWTLKSQEGK
ncbi:MAG: agmatinase family protein [Candidatus Peribacteraceae bacterium]|jgi:agmatinase